MSRQMMYRNAAQPHPIEAHKVDSLAIFYASQKKRQGRRGRVPGEAGGGIRRPHIHRYAGVLSLVEVN